MASEIRLGAWGTRAREVRGNPGGEKSWGTVRVIGWISSSAYVVVKADGCLDCAWLIALRKGEPLRWSCWDASSRECRDIYALVADPQQGFFSERATPNPYLIILRYIHK